MQCLSLLGSSNGGGHRFAAIVELVVVIGLVAIGVLCHHQLIKLLGGREGCFELIIMILFRPLLSK